MVTINIDAVHFQQPECLVRDCLKIYLCWPRATKPGSHLSIRRTDSHESAPSSAGNQPLPTCIDRARHPYDDTPEKSSQKDAHGHSSTCTSDLHRSRVRLSCLSPPAQPGGRPGRAGPSQTSPCGRAAAGRDRRPGLGTRPAPKRRHATGGRASARDRAGNRHATGGQASAHDRVVLRHATRLRHATGPRFGTPLPQLIPRRRVGLGRFSQLSKRWQNDAHGHLVSSREP